MSKAFSILVLLSILLSFCSAVHAGPEQRHTAAQDWANSIDKHKYGVIMVGSSMQGEGIDFPALSKAIGTPVMDARSGGSTTAWKYCFLRYVIPLVKHKPRVVVVTTRLNFLICPQKRLRWAVYERAVNRIAGEDRKLLDEIAFEGKGAPKWEYRYDGKEGPPYDSYYWDFSRAVKTSFLPHMIEQARKGGYKLVILRYKSRKYAEDPGWEPPQVKKYGQDITRYLHENGVIFLDYVYRPELKVEHYGKGDHLRKDIGRPIWTRLMADDLNAILTDKRAPNHRVPDESKAEGANPNNSTLTDKPKHQPGVSNSNGEKQTESVKGKSKE